MEDNNRPIPLSTNAWEYPYPKEQGNNMDKELTKKDGAVNAENFVKNDGRTLTKHPSEDRGDYTSGDKSSSSMLKKRKSEEMEGSNFQQPQHVKRAAPSLPNVFDFQQSITQFFDRYLKSKDKKDVKSMRKYLAKHLPHLVLLELTKLFELCDNVDESSSSSFQGKVLLDDLVDITALNERISRLDELLRNDIAVRFFQLGRKVQPKEKPQHNLLLSGIRICLEKAKHERYDVQTITDGFYLLRNFTDSEELQTVHSIFATKLQDVQKSEPDLTPEQYARIICSLKEYPNITWRISKVISRVNLKFYLTAYLRNPPIRKLPIKKIAKYHARYIAKGILQMMQNYKPDAKSADIGIPLFQTFDYLSALLSNLDPLGYVGESSSSSSSSAGDRTVIIERACLIPNQGTMTGSPRAGSTSKTIRFPTSSSLDVDNCDLASVTSSNANTSTTEISASDEELFTLLLLLMKNINSIDSVYRRFMKAILRYAGNMPSPVLTAILIPTTQQNANLVTMNYRFYENIFSVITHLHQMKQSQFSIFPEIELFIEWLINLLVKCYEILLQHFPSINGIPSTAIEELSRYLIKKHPLPSIIEGFAHFNASSRVIRRLFIALEHFSFYSLRKNLLLPNYTTDDDDDDDNNNNNDKSAEKDDNEFTDSFFLKKRNSLNGNNSNNNNNNNNNNNQQAEAFTIEQYSRIMKGLNGMRVPFSCPGTYEEVAEKSLFDEIIFHLMKLPISRYYYQQQKLNSNISPFLLSIKQRNYLFEIIKVLSNIPEDDICYDYLITELYQLFSFTFELREINQYFDEKRYYSSIEFSKRSPICEEKLQIFCFCSEIFYKIGKRKSYFNSSSSTTTATTRELFSLLTKFIRKSFSSNILNEILSWSTIRSALSTIVLSFRNFLSSFENMLIILPDFHLFYYYFLEITENVLFPLFPQFHAPENGTTTTTTTTAASSSSSNIRRNGKPSNFSDTPLSRSSSSSDQPTLSISEQMKLIRSYFDGFTFLVHYSSASSSSSSSSSSIPIPPLSQPPSYSSSATSSPRPGPSSSSLLEPLSPSLLPPPTTATITMSMEMMLMKLFDFTCKDLLSFFQTIQINPENNVDPIKIIKEFFQISSSKVFLRLFQHSFFKKHYFPLYDQIFRLALSLPSSIDCSMILLISEMIPSLINRMILDEIPENLRNYSQPMVILSGDYYSPTTMTTAEENGKEEMFTLHIILETIYRFFRKHKDFDPITNTAKNEPFIKAFLPFNGLVKEVKYWYDNFLKKYPAKAGGSGGGSGGGGGSSSHSSNANEGAPPVVDPAHPAGPPPPPPPPPSAASSVNLYFSPEFPAHLLFQIASIFHFPSKARQLFQHQNVCDLISILLYLSMIPVYSSTTTTTISFGQSYYKLLKSFRYVDEFLLFNKKYELEKTYHQNELGANATTSTSTSIPIKRLPSADDDLFFKSEPSMSFISPRNTNNVVAIQSSSTRNSLLQRLRRLDLIPYLRNDILRRIARRLQEEISLFEVTQGFSSLMEVLSSAPNVTPLPPLLPSSSSSSSANKDNKDSTSNMSKGKGSGASELIFQRDTLLAYQEAFLTLSFHEYNYFSLGDSIAQGIQLSLPSEQKQPNQRIEKNISLQHPSSSSSSSSSTSLILFPNFKKDMKEVKDTFYNKLIYEVKSFSPFSVPGSITNLFSTLLPFSDYPLFPEIGGVHSDLFFTSSSSSSSSSSSPGTPLSLLESMSSSHWRTLQDWFIEIFQEKLFEMNEKRLKRLKKIHRTKQNQSDEEDADVGCYINVLTRCIVHSFPSLLAIPLSPSFSFPPASLTEEDEDWNDQDEEDLRPGRTILFTPSRSTTPNEVPSFVPSRYLLLDLLPMNSAISSSYAHWAHDSAAIYEQFGVVYGLVMINLDLRNQEEGGGSRETRLFKGKGQQSQQQQRVRELEIERRIKKRMNILARELMKIISIQ